VIEIASIEARYLHSVIVALEALCRARITYEKSDE
jgi:hypothetical protein